MRCERARLRLSVALDETPADDEAAALRAHLAGCAACATEERTWREMRRELRVEALGTVPDVTSRVLQALPAVPLRPAAPPRTAVPPARTRSVRQLKVRRFVPVLATFIAGAVVGAALMAINRPAEVVAADLRARVLEAQRALETLDADLRVVERGWHPDVPTRTFSGTLRYRAPESVALHVVDETRYPSSKWRNNDNDLVITEGRWWSRGPGACPVQLQPRCSLNQARVRVLTQREPFAEDSPAPLDLVLPARSFNVPTGTTELRTATVAGHAAIGLRTTVAQVTPILSGLRTVGNWRELYPGDEVELWLDKDHLVPLKLIVRPAADAERGRWEAERGYRDGPGTTLLEVSLASVDINSGLPTESFPVAPHDALSRGAGFVVKAVDPALVPVPSYLPAGMRAYRAGLVAASSPAGSGGHEQSPAGSGGHEQGVRTWTDGRSWVKVRATRTWVGGTLFGDLGDVVRPVLLEGAGVAYVGERGDKVALHADGIDVTVEGSVTEADLRGVAASLGVRGVTVPTAWAEAGTGTLLQAESALPRLLVASKLEGFRAPGVRIDDHVVTLDYAGEGARGFRLTEALGDALVPPLDPDVRGVEVRSTIGRYLPSTGELEWVEAGKVVSLRSTTLSLAGLLGVAARLVARP